jgi:hypothetical protein
VITTVKLSHRVRPNSEVAAWVHTEILAMEATMAEQAREISVLKDKTGAVVLPELIKRAADVVEGLHGEPLPGAMPVRVQKLKAALESLNASRVPEGWQLVPLNPAKFLDMGFAYIDAARESEPNMRWAFSHAGYKAMLSAAPAPAVEPASDEAFCDGHCTWLDHQPGCSLHEPAHSDVSAPYAVVGKGFSFIAGKHIPTITVSLSPCHVDDNGAWNRRDAIANRIRALLAGGEV